MNDISSHTANKTHHGTEDAREMRDFQLALELAIDSEISYEEAGDMIGFSEIQASKALAYRHMFRESKNGGYLVLAKHSAMAGVEIARNSGIPEALAIPVFNLAKIYDEIGEHEQAKKLFSEALDHITNNPPKHQDRPAVKLDFKLHLLGTELKLGNKNVEQEMVDIIHQIEADDQESDYNKKVWASGGYLVLAEYLQEFKYLDEARKIIESDDRLELRNLQWQELTNELE